MATTNLGPTDMMNSQCDVLATDDVCDELQFARRTFCEWRAKGTGSERVKLPNGNLRIRTALEAWRNAPEGRA